MFLEQHVGVQSMHCTKRFGGVASMRATTDEEREDRHMALLRGFEVCTLRVAGLGLRYMLDCVVLRNHRAVETSCQTSAIKKHVSPARNALAAKNTQRTGDRRGTVSGRRRSARMKACPCPSRNALAVPHSHSPDTISLSAATKSHHQPVTLSHKPVPVLRKPT